MTVRERVIASRLISKVDEQSSYAKQIGISYEVLPVNKAIEVNRKERKGNNINRD